MQRGFTLLEILVVMFIAGIIASVTLPSFSSSDPYRLELAANDVAIALRYARDESIRTGLVHGVHIDRTASRFYAYKAGTGANPLVGLVVLYHPLSKQLFDSTISNNSSTKGVAVSNAQDPFAYINFATKQSHVLFDRQGMPFWKDTGTNYILDNANVQLIYNDLTKTITLDRGYGRVSIQ